MVCHASWFGANQGVQRLDQTTVTPVRCSSNQNRAVLGTLVYDTAQYGQKPRFDRKIPRMSTTVLDFDG